jgi:hypothetical protein
VLDALPGIGWHDLGPLDDLPLASRFALADGAVLRGPATAAQPTLETRVVAGRVQARAHAEGSHWSVIDPSS